MTPLFSTEWEREEYEREKNKLSPAKLSLLKSVVSLQEMQLRACTQIFQGLSDHPDAEVSHVSRISYEALTETALVIDAMIDQLAATIH